MKMVATFILNIVLASSVIISDGYVIQHGKRGSSNPCRQNTTTAGPIICQPWDKTVEDLIPRLTGISVEISNMIAQNYNFPAGFAQLLPSNITGLLPHVDKANGEVLTKNHSIPFLTLAFNDFTTLGNYLKLVIQGLPEGQLKSSYASVRVHTMDLIQSIHVGLRGLGSDIPDDSGDHDIPDDLTRAKCTSCRDFQIARDLKDISEYFKDKLQSGKLMSTSSV